MNFLVLTNQYPKKTNLYRNGFVHQRVKAYSQSGHNTVIWVMNDQQDKEIYYFDGVMVIEGNPIEFNRYMKEGNIDRILIHFLLENMVDALLNIDTHIPVLVWVHGYEALKWNHRLFNPWNLSAWRGLKIKENYSQLKAFKRFNEKNNLKHVSYIFVSNWMKEMAEKDINTKFKNSYIIPNYINTELFNYKCKNEEQRKKILLIRPFHNRKYANDVAAKAIIELSKFPEFKDLEFSIYGEGKYFNIDTEQLKKFQNVKINNRFLKQDEIADMHKKFGVFLCPTRQDAQGVSMCEAMASGLVPITSNNTAIPEFVDQNRTGFLTEGPKDIANAILNLYHNPESFKDMSKKTSDRINEICSYGVTIEKELDKIVNLR